MIFKFEKYQGTGNDFILIDDRSELFPADLELISKLCDRKFGIGSDGLMLIRNSSTDFEMIFYNPDGSKSLCGNGSRCSVIFAHKLGLANSAGNFTTTDGEHRYRIEGEEVAIEMHDVDKIDQKLGHSFANTGSPHLVIETDNLDALDIINEARTYRYDNCFENIGGTNVNFVRSNDDGSFSVRTYERGVEDETLSCGTGVTAVAIAVGTSHSDQPVRVRTKGGDLSVLFHKNQDGFKNIWLKGPAKYVYSGEIELDDFRE